MESERNLKQPPRPGISRRIDNSCLNDEMQRRIFFARVETVTKCGFIAEVRAEGYQTLTLYAVRRPKK